jgi:hypothetical protein
VDHKRLGWLNAPAGQHEHLKAKASDSFVGVLPYDLVKTNYPLNNQPKKCIAHFMQAAAS